MIAEMNIYQVGGLLATLMIALTGLFVFLSNRSDKKRQHKAEDVTEKAEVMVAELSGWQTLFKTLREQLLTSQEETAQCHRDRKMLREEMELLERKVREITERNRYDTIIAGQKKTQGMVAQASEKAGNAYREANSVNTKIADLQEEVSEKLTTISDNAETARVKASNVSDKADIIGETGTDTNERVRKIEAKT